LYCYAGRWAVEGSFGQLIRFRRRAEDYERLPEALAGLYFVAFVTLMLVHAVAVLQGSWRALIWIVR
jgi:hypothetical protein